MTSFHPSVCTPWCRPPDLQDVQLLAWLKSSLVCVLSALPSSTQRTVNCLLSSCMLLSSLVFRTDRTPSGLDSPPCPGSLGDVSLADSDPSAPISSPPLACPSRVLTTACTLLRLSTRLVLFLSFQPVKKDASDCLLLLLPPRFGRSRFSKLHFFAFSEEFIFCQFLFQGVRGVSCSFSMDVSGGWF